MRILAPDPSGRQGVANQAGNGGTLAFGQFEPLAQTGVGHGPAGQVLQYSMLVAGLDALGLGHVGELAGGVKNDLERIVGLDERDGQQPEQLDGRHDFLETRAAFLADAVATEGGGENFVARFWRRTDQAVNRLAGQQAARIAELDAIVEHLDHRPRADDGEVLMDKGIGDQLAQGDLGIDGNLGAQRLPDDFAVGQAALEIGNETLEADGIALLADHLVDGVHLVEPAITNDAQALSLQRVERAQVAGGGERAEVREVTAIAKRLDHLLLDQPTQRSVGIRRQRPFQELADRGKVELPQQVRQREAGGCAQFLPARGATVRQHRADFLARCLARRAARADPGVFDGFPAAMHGFDRLLRNMHEQQRHALPVDHRMIDGNGRFERVPAQVGQLIDACLDRLLGDAGHGRRRIVDAESQESAAGLVAERRQMLDQPFLVRRQPTLPVEFVRLRGDRFCRRMATARPSQGFDVLTSQQLID